MKSYTVFKREILSYIFSPALYATLALWCLLSGYFFYTDVIYFNWINIASPTSLAAGIFNFYFNDLRFILIFVLPLITMRLFAEEKKSGTIELITTYPVRDLEIIGGKFVSSLCILLMILMLSFLPVLYLGFIWGFSELLTVLAGFLGLFLLGSSLISCGMFVSSLTENQFIAGLCTIALFVFFWFLTWNEMIADANTINILIRFSLFDRVNNLFRGIIDLKHIVFFILFNWLFLFLTLQVLQSREWKGAK